MDVVDTLYITWKRIMYSVFNINSMLTGPSSLTINRAGLKLIYRYIFVDLNDVLPMIMKLYFIGPYT